MKHELRNTNTATAQLIQRKPSRDLSIAITSCSVRALLHWSSNQKYKCHGNGNHQATNKMEIGFVLLHWIPHSLVTRLDLC